MELKKIYEDLTVALNWNENEIINGENINISYMHKLIERLKEEIRKESAKTCGDSKPLKYASMVLKYKYSKNRPILQKAIIKDGFQIFTNSYIAFKMKNHITGLDLHQEKDFEKYPDMSKIFKEPMLFTSILLKDLVNELSIMKDEDCYLLKNHFNYKIGINVKNLKIMYNVLRFKKDDFITFGLLESQNEDYLRPIIVKNNEDTCLLLPVRQN